MSVHRRPSARRSRLRVVLTVAVVGMLSLGVGVVAFWPAALHGIGEPIRHLAGASVSTSDQPAAIQGPHDAGPVPGPDNTGWQHTGVRLRPLACGANGELVVDSNGAKLDGVLIGCNVRIDADDVTISRSEVVAGGPWAIYKPDGYTGLTVSDVEVAGRPGCQAALAFSHYTATRVNIHGCQDGALIEQGSVVQDSWIHDFWDGTQNGHRVGEIAHDGVATTGGSDLTIRHNRIDNPHSDNSCILIGGEFGQPSNIVIEDNYLDGGYYSVIIAAQGANRVIKNNTFTRAFVAGPANLSGSYVWAGNDYTDGSVVPG